MSVVVRDVPTTDAASFPAGGRPLEWRALEEAAAFEKWFEGHGRAAEGSAAAQSSEAGPTARQASTQPQDQPRVSEPAGAQSVATPDDTQAVAITGRDRAMPSPSETVAGRSQSGFGLATASLRMASAAAASESAGIRAWVDPGRTYWSRLAVTAVIAEAKVKVWLRDYRLAEGEIESLHRQLAEDLRKLGYGLALLVFNGQVRHTAEGHHGD